MRILIALLQWLALRAGAGLNGNADAGGAVSAPWQAATTADRAGRLVPSPEHVEQEVSRSLSQNWALWLAVGVVILVVGIGYIRRRMRWRSRDESRPAWLSRRGRR